MNTKRFLISLILISLMSACVSSGGGGGSRLVDTFYKGKGQILFFVNSFSMSGKKGNPDIAWDFTYDFYTDSIRPVIVNFSVYDKKFYPGPYSATLNSIRMDSIRLLVADLQGRRHRTRLSGLIPFDAFRKIALSDTVHLKVQCGPDSFEVLSDSKWSRKARHIRTEMLDVIRLTEFQK